MISGLLGVVALFAFAGAMRLLDRGPEACAACDRAERADCGGSCPALEEALANTPSRSDGR
jgi:hypothetical protein